MPRVRSTGGIAVQAHAPAAVKGIGAGAVVVNVRLFAKLDVGVCAVDRRPVSFTVGAPREALRGVDPYEELGLDSVPRFAGGTVDSSSPGPWSGLLDDLRTSFAVATDAETLQLLPFDLLHDPAPTETLGQ